jgi:hypothetical protein
MSIITKIKKRVLTPLECNVLLNIQKFHQNKFTVFIKKELVNQDYYYPRSIKIIYRKISEILINTNNLNEDPYYINFLRELSISIEELDLDLSFNLMLKAHILRPEGDLIRRKLLNYSDRLTGVNTREALFNYSKHKYLNPADMKYLRSTIAIENQNLKLDFVKDTTLNDEKVITILSSFPGNFVISNLQLQSYIKTILAYSYAISNIESVKTIRVVFTNEWVDGYSQKLKLDKIYEAIDKLGLNVKLLEKISFHLISTVTELSNILDGIVIKFKSSIVTNSFHICEKDIFRNYPVICATFNSAYREDNFSDATLVRSKNITAPNKILFNPPTFYDLESYNYITPKTFVVLTAIEGNRLKDFIKNLNALEWSSINEFLNSGFIWVLAGYPMIHELIPLIPLTIYNKHKKNITFQKHLDLNLFFEKTYALLNDSNSLGGGNTTRLAMCKNVPVLSSFNELSDTSNILHVNNLSTTFIEQLNLLVKWKSDDTLRETFLETQHKHSKYEFSISNKAEELSSIIQFAEAKFNLRNNIV